MMSTVLFVIPKATNFATKHVFTDRPTCTGHYRLIKDMSLSKAASIMQLNPAVLKTLCAQWIQLLHKCKIRIKS